MNKGTHFSGQPLYGQLLDLLDKNEILKYCCPLKLFEREKDRAGFLAWNSAPLVTFVCA